MERRRHRAHRRSRAGLLLSALLGLGLTPLAAATEQIPDTLVVDGQARPLHAEPFGALLDQPAHWATFRRLFAPALGACTANWRGYKAWWAIEDGELRLQRLVAGACGRNPPEVPLDAFFPGERAPVAARWYSGQLLVPLGERGGDDHAGYSARYPRYLLLDIDAGRVVARREISHDMLDALRARARAAQDDTP
ncbi:hypothetical protein [Luteimonas huabeiensis]|uniref:hypothetical protein n=1 Tax=Luteimonas huabeiensis TaxID=1244513 RepID=UPI000463E6C5|nr:hypothetical protein [Luteimonas huabeiensis]